MPKYTLWIIFCFSLILQKNNTQFVKKKHKKDWNFCEKECVILGSHLLKENQNKTYQTSTKLALNIRYLFFDSSHFPSVVDVAWPSSSVDVTGGDETQLDPQRSVAVPEGGSTRRSETWLEDGAILFILFIIFRLLFRF